MQEKKTQLFLAILCLLAATKAEAISYPVTPAVPEPAGFEQKVTDEKGEQKSRATVSEEADQKVTAVLGSGARITGSIMMPVELAIRHQKHGLTFNLAISPDQLKKIRVVSYSRKEVQKKENGTLYEFEPLLLEITLKNKRSYVVNNTFPFLRRFEIDTIDGKTTLFSYFADFYQNSSGWQEIKGRDLSLHDTVGHPQSVVEWDFSGEEKPARSKK